MAFFLPGWQSSQDSAPLELTVPAVQVEHVVERVVSVYLSASQSVHPSGWPPLEYLPSRQLGQLPAPALEYVPASQSVQESLSSSEYLPASQSSHALAPPAEEKRPAAHELQPGLPVPEA